MLRARPLVPLAAGFLAGIAAARAINPSLPLGLLAVTLLLLLTRWRPPAIILLLGFALGGLRQEAAEMRDAEPLRQTIEGVVRGPPRIYRSLEDPDAGPAASGSFVVGRVQVRAYRREIPLVGGEVVRCTGKPKRPRHATNPGQFDRADHLERRGIDAVMTLDELEVLEAAPPWSRFRAWLRSLFDRDMRPEVGGLLGAIVLGRRESAPDGLVLLLQRSGTAHLLAISGQHLVIVTMTFWTLLVLAGARGRGLSLALLVLTGTYALLTGPPVSVTRAWLMLAAYLGADLFWRRRDAPSAMAAAALAICAFNPAQVADVGFQLSFCAVLGLMIVAPVFHAFTETGHWLWNRLRMAMGVSLAAWLSTAPIVLANFHLMTPGIVLGNLVLVPLLSLELLLGLLHLTLAPLGAGCISGLAAGLVFDAIRATSTIVTSLPLAYFYAPAPGTALTLLYYAALAAWAAWCRLTRDRKWKPLCILPAVILLGLAPLRYRPPEGTYLALLDVGRGSCAYLEWPDGRNAMVDCGSLDLRDAGASVAAPFVWSRGRTRVDTLVLSHPDRDHVNGAPSVIDLLRVRRVVVTRAFRDWTWPEGLEVITVERHADPLRLGRLEILGPPVWEKYGRTVSSNETSIVLRAGGILLPGDIEERGVGELLTLPDLRARVLVLPHHGKHFRQHRELLERVYPEIILASAREGYYDACLLEALPFPARVTGLEGAILLDLGLAPP